MHLRNYGILTINNSQASGIDQFRDELQREFINQIQ